MANDSANPATSLTLEAGDEVGSYLIERMLGSGPWAAVYRGRDTLVGRAVAIKQIFSARVEDPESMVQRARDEGMLQKQAARSQPRHLVQLVDIIDDQRGLMLVSGLVEGRSLESHLAQTTGPMAPRRALTIIGALAKGLGALHAQGIVDRNLKPTNVLLGDNGSVKISDFGLSGIMQDQAGLTVGSARYTAPEMLQGDRADTRADLYSLGMIGYEILAGREQFDKAFKTILRDPRNQQMRWVKWQSNPRTKAPALTGLVPGLDPQIEALVNRLLEKDPDRRFGSTDELLKAIGRIIGGGESTTSEASAESADSAGSAAGSTAAATSFGSAQSSGAKALEGQGPGDHSFSNSPQPQTPGTTRSAATDPANKTSHAAKAEPKSTKTKSSTASKSAKSSTTSPGDTAPLPVRGRILRYAAVAALALGLAIGAYFLVKGRVEADHKKERAHHQAVQLLDQARKDLQQGNQAAAASSSPERSSDQSAEDSPAKYFTRAKQAFEQLGEKYADVPNASARSQAGITLANAHLAMESGRFDAAVNELGQVRQMSIIEDDRQASLLRLQDQASRSAAFADAISAIKDKLNARHFADARKQINQWQGFDLSRTEQATLNKLAKTRYAREADTDLQSQLALARRQVDQGKTDQAIQTLKQAVPDSSTAKLVGPTVRKIKALYAKLTSRREYQQLLASARQARQAAKIDQAIDDYQQALKIRGSQAIKSKLTQLQSRRLYQRGQAQLKKGQTAEAERLFTAALGKNPNESDARAALKNIESVGQKNRFVNAADSALAAGDFDTAVAQYTNALKLGDDPQLNEKLDQARLRLKHQRGVEAMKKGELAKARKLFEQAKTIDPDDTGLIQSMDTLGKRVKYRKLKTAGDDARADGDFGIALGKYKQARAIRDTADIRQAITETQYADMVATARVYIDNKNYRAAKAMLDTAAQTKITQEIKKLRTQIKQKQDRGE